MFTGIVEELGRVRAITPNEGGARIEIGARAVLDDAVLGASIAVNGCCLTVVAFDRDEGWWAADAVVETMARTNLGTLAPGDPVNLERPLRVGDRLGGHMVQGHVDGTGTVVSTTPLSDGSVVVSVTAAPEVLRYVVAKGSITIDGASLTVTDVTPTQLSVALIPHTQEVTTFGRIVPGAIVNLENDVVAKYVERLVHVAPGEH